MRLVVLLLLESERIHYGLQLGGGLEALFLRRCKLTLQVTKLRGTHSRCCTLVLFQLRYLLGHLVDILLATEDFCRRVILLLHHVHVHAFAFLNCLKRFVSLLLHRQDLLLH